MRQVVEPVDVAGIGQRQRQCLTQGVQGFQLQGAELAAQLEGEVYGAEGLAGMNERDDDRCVDAMCGHALAHLRPGACILGQVRAVHQPPLGQGPAGQGPGHRQDAEIGVLGSVEAQAVGEQEALPVGRQLIQGDVVGVLQAHEGLDGLRTDGIDRELAVQPA